MTRNYYTTSHIRYKWKPICIFCEKEIVKIEESVGERDWVDHYPCECEGAKEEQRLLEQLNIAKHKLNKHIRDASSQSAILGAKKKQEEEITVLQNNELSRAVINIRSAESPEILA